MLACVKLFLAVLNCLARRFHRRCLRWAGCWHTTVTTSAMSSGVPAVWQAAAALLGWGEAILMLLRRVVVLLAVADRPGM